MTRPDYLKMIAELPHSNPDLESEGPTTTVAVFRSALQACDHVLISSPEYVDRPQRHSQLRRPTSNGRPWSAGLQELGGDGQASPTIVGSL